MNNEQPLVLQLVVENELAAESWSIEPTITAGWKSKDVKTDGCKQDSNLTPKIYESNKKVIN